MQGKTIRIYLVDGVPTGILTAEIINWTGKVVMCPRTRLAELSKRDEGKRTGVYFLVGPDPNSPSRDCVYIGEGDNVLTRLAYHDKDESKDFWTRAVIVISKDENLTKSHGRFLESRLIQLAQEAKRATLANGTAPDTPLLPESDVADMEYFIEQVRMILPVLGLNVLQPKPTQGTSVGGKEGVSPQFVIKGVGASGVAVEIGNEFVVLKGSTARKEGVQSWRCYRSLRDELVSEGKMAESRNPNCYVFTEDVPFSSPSAAAVVIFGRSTNGRTEWKVKGTSESYQEWHEQKLKKAREESVVQPMVVEKSSGIVSSDA